MIVLAIILLVTLLIAIWAPIVRYPFRLALTHRASPGSPREPYVSIIPRFKRAAYKNGVLDVQYSYRDAESLVEALNTAREGVCELNMARKLIRESR